VVEALQIADADVAQGVSPWYACDSDRKSFFSGRGDGHCRQYWKGELERHLDCRGTVVGNRTRASGRAAPSLHEPAGEG